MAEELVKFPGWGSDRCRDSGEGGLFVMLFIPEPESWSHGCHVDVVIEATRPDVMVYPRETALWQPYDHDKSMTEYQVYDVLKEHGKRGMLGWVASARSAEDTSVPMLVAMHLGSTPGSFWDEQYSEYWRATPEDLTPEGRVLFNSLEAAYGIHPILATFLDT
jgi:hypothetical protein